MLGVLHTLLHYPERYPEPPYLTLVQTNDQILAIAIRTPPNNLLLSHVQDLNALNLIAQDLQHEKLPGVAGLVAETETFVQIWQSLTGQSYQQGVESRIYQLTQVEPVTTVKGHLRLAIPGDRPLLLKWFAAFNAEIDLISDDKIERRVDVELKRQSTALLDNGMISQDFEQSLKAFRLRFIPSSSNAAAEYLLVGGWRSRFKGWRSAIFRNSSSDCPRLHSS